MKVSNFVIVVSLDGKHPIWYPDIWIWGDLNRYGIDGAASVIEARVREVGGQVKSDSITDYASRVSLDVSLADDCRRWKNSAKGVSDALAAVEALFELLKANADQASQSGIPRLGLGFRRRSNDFAEISGDGARFSVSWSRTYQSSLERSGLTIVLSEGGKLINNRWVVEPKQIERVEYGLDWDRSRRIGWREHSGKSFHTSLQLAEFWVRCLLDCLKDRALHSASSRYGLS